jgi:hypothetical protein
MSGLSRVEHSLADQDPGEMESQDKRELAHPKKN